VEADELWGFVGSKGDPWWVWVALGAGTRQVVAMVCGGRDEDTAVCLWDALPDEYREGATFCTDFLPAYRAVVPEERQAVVFDPRVLEQVLGNLIDNARKYSRQSAERRIRVRAVPVGSNRVAVEVEDRGPGVPAGEVRNIFRPFSRGSTSTDTGGAGLGLALAKD
jgi:signal transduction histidine kinase